MTGAKASRRQFVASVGMAGLCASCGLAPAIGTPVLWGDGHHDDSDALQALFDGKLFDSANSALSATIENGEVVLRGGRYLVSKSLRVPRFAQFHDTVFLSQATDSLGEHKGPGLQTKNLAWV